LFSFCDGPRFQLSFSLRVFCIDDLVYILNFGFYNTDHIRYFFNPGRTESSSDTEDRSQRKCHPEIFIVLLNVLRQIPKTQLLALSCLLPQAFRFTPLGFVVPQTPKKNSKAVLVRGDLFDLKQTVSFELEHRPHINFAMNQSTMKN